jgi:hypothetical protein
MQKLLNNEIHRLNGVFLSHFFVHCSYQTDRGLPRDVWGTDLIAFGNDLQIRIVYLVAPFQLLRFYSICEILETASVV